MLEQIITKKVDLLPDWKDNEMEGFKEYLKGVYSANSAISDLFEDEQLDVVSMTTEMKVLVRPKDKSLVADGTISEEISDTLAISNE